MPRTRKLTLPDVKKLWWWRRPNDDWEFYEATHTTKMQKLLPNDVRQLTCRWKSFGRERAAWYYELLRRHDRKLGLPPYWDLDSCMQLEVELLLTNEEEALEPSERSEEPQASKLVDHPVVRRLDPIPDWLPEEIGPSNPKPERGWGCIPAHWNLHASDSAIVPQFLLLLDEERRRQRIVPVNCCGGKPPSWRWPELMDEVELLNRKLLTDGERSSLSRARTLAKGLADRYAAGSVKVLRRSLTAKRERQRGPQPDPTPGPKL